MTMEPQHNIRDALPTISDEVFDSDGAVTAGQVIGNHYQVVRELGSGGVSVVYEVQHQLLDKTFALKLLRTDKLTDGQASLRFKQEAKVAVGLAHPNIAATAEFGIDSRMGKPYLVTEYVKGEPLADLIKPTLKLSVDAALNIAIDLCDALQYAHGKGVIHRDLKPSNVMVTTLTDGKFKPIIIDFGIAKFLDPGDQAPHLTKTGEVFGTPQYMSPEQAVGVPIDERSDIYSLGCIIYEMFAGMPPFTGSSVVEVLMLQMNAPLPVLAAPLAPRALQGILEKATEKKPELRYQSAAELKSDLVAVLNNQPVSVRKKFRLNPSLVKRLRPVVAGFATVTLLGAAFLVASQQVVPPPNTVPWLTEQLKKDPTRADLFRLRGNLLFAARRYDEACADYTQAIDLHPVDSARLYAARAGVRNAQREPQLALTDVKSALQLDPTLAPAYLEEANAEMTVARNKPHAILSDYEAVVQSASQAIRFAPKLAAEMPWLLTRGHYFRGVAYKEMEKLSEAESDLRLALAQNQSFGYATAALAQVLLRQQKYAEALPIATKAIQESMSDSDDYQLYWTRALIYEKLGRHNEALKDARIANQMNPRIKPVKELLLNLEKEVAPDS